MQYLIQQHGRLMDYFMPERLAIHRERADRARMFLISHTLGPIIGNSVPLMLWRIDPTPGLDIAVLALSITGFWVFPFLLKAGYDYHRLVVASVLNLNFCIFLSCYFNGGPSSPILPWVLTIPILSFFYIGGDRTLRNTLLAIFGVSFVGFAALYTAYPPAPNDWSDAGLLTIGIVSTVAALCYVATMAIYYAKIFDRGVELEIEIRRREKLTLELRRSVAATVRASSARDEFLARMSHELRTPLNAIIGYSEVLKEDALDGGDVAMVEDIDRIHDAGQYLLRLINIILDLARLESGRMQFDVHSHDLAEMLEAIAAYKAPKIARRNNRIELAVDKAIGTIETDRGRLGEVLAAIIRNAAEHTQDGLITLSARRLTDVSGKGRFEITIADTGEGIAPEQMATLFEIDMEEREAGATRFGGTGMHMTVSRKLAHALGGEITATSTLGEGSRFTIIVPERWNAPAAKPRLDPAPPQRLAA